MIGAPDWRADGGDWPNREASQFVEAAGLRWHVQRAGAGPAVLLLHGTGASTHSWRRMLPLLARRFTVVAPDLPGHGFTTIAPAPQMSLPGIARAVTALLRRLSIDPALVVGHSAGAAIGMRMAIEDRVRPAAIVSLNGALLKLEGSTAFFPGIARLLASVPVTPWLFSLQASNRGMVERLLAGTGSRIDEDDARLYARLLGRPGHVSGALRMMSRWDLGALALEMLDVPVTLVAGQADRMIPPADAGRAAARLPRARVVMLPGLGHLAHEEEPAMIAGLVEQAYDEATATREVA